ncbi:MAG: hypothetical protein V4515_10840 [Chloroflexota bacterium]
MTRVVAIILHAVPGPGAGPLERSFAETRARNAAAQVIGFTGEGVETRIVETHPGGQPFSQRLRELSRDHEGAGSIVLGSGSIPLATRADRRSFVAAAAGTAPVESRGVLVNNRFSADILAIPPGVDLDRIPDLAADNGVPRWLADQGVPVHDLRRRWRLQFDLDSPIDVALAAGRIRADVQNDVQAIESGATKRLDDTLARVAEVAANPAAELLIAGRTSAATLGWIERHTASRTRALVEERGMKTAEQGQRPTRSSLGLLLDRDGPEALGELLATLSDAAAVDTRVLMAHHFGRDEAGWPAAEDRFASDLLLHERIVDPWLRALTAAAAGARIPILLGGHTLVGPGLRLALGAGRR